MSGSFAAYPGAKAHGTLFIEAFGQLARDTERQGIVAGEGALWALFSARAQLMGWSTTPARSSSAHIAGPRARPVLWWTNEAELSAGNGASRIGWVQVELDMGVEPALALPALIQCFDDTLRRFGVVELSGLQVTASHLQAGEESVVWDLVSGFNWFTTGQGPRAEALIAFDNGLLQGRSASEFVASLPRMNGRSFAFGPLVPMPLQHPIEVPVEAPIDVVLSPASSGVSVGLPEWSASAAAWVLAVVIDTARAGGPGTRNFAVRLTRVQ